MSKLFRMIEDKARKATELEHYICNTIERNCMLDKRMKKKGFMQKTSTGNCVLLERADGLCVLITVEEKNRVCKKCELELEEVSDNR